MRGMSQALVPNKNEAFATMEQFLLQDSTQEKIARILPSGMTHARLARYALAAMTRQPKLLKCTQASVGLALMDAAYFGLEPNPVIGLAYLVPFQNGKTKQLECQFMIGYRGFRHLGMRSGLVKGDKAALVYKSEWESGKFRWREHENPPFHHEVDCFGPNRTVDDIVGVYAATLSHHDRWEGVTLSRAQVERYRKKSRAQNEFAWTEFWDAMAIKTAIRRAYGKLPLAPNDPLAVAIAHDTQLELGQPANHNEILEGAVQAPEVIDHDAELADDLAG